MSSKGLGRGLDALLRRTDMGAARQEKNDTPEKETGTEHSPTLLPLSHLHANPSQPRQTFDAESLAELAASIREQGIIQPLLVRPLADRPGHYQIVAGERRWRAARQAGLGQVRVHVGQRLSYPQERIVSGTAEELAKEQFDDLAVVLAENPAPTGWKAGAPCLWDDQLIRGKSPMTKENIRLLAVARLGIMPESVVWDVGAGTGSVSAACAMAAWQGQVWAVEKEPDALELIEQNKQALGLSNLHIVPGEAPGVLAELPKPDCVFIGGSSGSMDGIFQVVLEKNPTARICLTAVSLESLTDGLACMKRFGLNKVDVTQISAAQAKTLGRYHMMMGQNPVWILSGEGQA